MEQKLSAVGSEQTESNGSLRELCGDLKQLIALTEGSNIVYRVEEYASDSCKIFST